MNLSKRPEMVKDGEAWSAAVHGTPKSQTQVNNYYRFTQRNSTGNKERLKDSQTQTHTNTRSTVSLDVLP